MLIIIDDFLNFIEIMNWVFMIEVSIFEALIYIKIISNDIAK